MTRRPQQETSQAAASAEKIRRDELERQVNLSYSLAIKSNPFLPRKFLEIAKDLDDLKNGNRVLKYVMVNDESGILLGIAEDINTAIIDY